MNTDIFYDYLPIIVFFVLFKLSNLYDATMGSIIICLIIYGHALSTNKKVSTNQKITIGSLALLGSATLLLHNPKFIQWKPTIVYWIFSIVLLGSALYRPHCVMERLLGKETKLQSIQWKFLSKASALFFLVLGLVNIWVAYTCSLNTWVYFKLFGSLICTLLYVASVGVFIYKNQRTYDSAT